MPTSFGKFYWATTHSKLLFNRIKVYEFSFSSENPMSIVLDKIQHFVKTHLKNALGIGKVLNNAVSSSIRLLSKDSTW